MTARKWTLAVMAAGVLLWVAWDVAVALNSVRGDTISEITLGNALSFPIIEPLAVGLILGVILGHLFWAQRPDEWPKVKL